MNTRFTWKSMIGVIGLMAVALTACAPAPAAAPQARDAYEAMPAATAAPAATEAPAMSAPGAGGDTASNAQPQQQRLIIRTAEMSIVVTNTQEQLNAISALAGQYGGFVVQSSTYDAGNALQGNITIRVDAKNFDAALGDIRRLAVDVRNESIRGEDVTAEFVDLDAQLKNLEAAEAQLTKIMENATETEDVLNVFQQLTQIRGQIDQIKGRMKFLSQSAALSTINVNLIPDALTQPVEVGGWRIEGVVKSAVEALIGTLQALASIAVWLVIVVLPALVVMALPVLLVVWLIRRARRNRKPATPASPTTIPPAQ